MSVRALLPLLLLLSAWSLSGCDDTLFGKQFADGDTLTDETDPGDDTDSTGGDTSPADDTSTSDDTATSEDGFCAVQSLFSSSCLICHAAAVNLGELDLETDLHGELVGQPSTLYAGRTLVVAGDPEGSFLLTKLLGEQDGDEGGPMPSTPLGASDIELVRVWIADGATADCDDPDTGTTVARYHPDGWAEPDEHGMAAKYQEDTCLDCHGADLTGVGAALSCDTCHTPDDPQAWRTDCTFCHGGEDNATGAPPVDINNSAAGLSFSAHTAHVTTNIHGAYDCAQCHQKPVDVLSYGHFLVGDITAGVAEVDFSGGLSPAASYTPGSCSSLYCHGDGQGDNGSWSVSQGTPDCGDCHASRASGDDAWDRMSDDHDKHLEEGITCSECHNLTADSAENIVTPALHVNGSVELGFDASITANTAGAGVSCTGSCHGETHEVGEHSWYD